MLFPKFVSPRSVDQFQVNTGLADIGVLNQSLQVGKPAARDFLRHHENECGILFEARLRVRDFVDVWRDYRS